MSKNYMPEVARMLGVEIGEPFDILVDGQEINCLAPYVFEEEDFYNTEGDQASEVLYGLLTGLATIKKLSWMPKGGEWFWTVDGKGNVEKYHFNSALYDLALLNMGNCFPSKEAAKAAVPEMLAKFEEIRKGVRE